MTVTFDPAAVLSVLGIIALGVKVTRSIVRLEARVDHHQVLLDQILCELRLLNRSERGGRGV